MNYTLRPLAKLICRNYRFHCVRHPRKHRFTWFRSQNSSKNNSAIFESLIQVSILWTVSGFRLQPVHSFYTRSAPPCLLRARLRHKVSGAAPSRIGQISRDREHVLSTSLYPNWGHVTQQWWRHLQLPPAFTIYGQSCNASRLSIQHLLIWAWAGWAAMWHRADRLL